MVRTFSVARAKPSMSFTVPVEVSERTHMAAFISGSRDNASATWSLSALTPQSYSSSVTSRPNALLILTQRFPKLPLLTTSTLSPGEKRFWIAPSKAPVPLAAWVKMSFSVRKTCFRLSFTRVNTSPNSGVRWWMIGIAPAADTSGGLGVGPGDIKRYLFIMGSEDSSRAADNCKGYFSNYLPRWLHSGTGDLQTVAFSLATRKLACSYDSSGRTTHLRAS